MSFTSYSAIIGCKNTEHVVELYVKTVRTVFHGLRFTESRGIFVM